MVHLEAQILHVFLAAHHLQILLPALAIGRVGEHEIKHHPRKGIVRQR